MSLGRSNHGFGSNHAGRAMDVSSGAHGLFQMLPGSKFKFNGKDAVVESVNASLGANGLSNVRINARVLINHVHMSFRCDPPDERPAISGLDEMAEWAA